MEHLRLFGNAAESHGFSHQLVVEIQRRAHMH
jgi:hypothetical protein